MAKQEPPSAASGFAGKVTKVTFEDGIAWVRLDRPEQRNAMDLAVADEMNAILDALETDERCGVLVLSGEGEAFSAGMDLQGFFRAIDRMDDIGRRRAMEATRQWQWRRLMHYPKPTIAMVNGWCFGGAFTPLICCDLAIADEKATFGLSEINWGILPGGQVSKAVSTLLNDRKAMYYIMTGETFDGRQAAEIGLVNEAVPKERLEARTRELCKVLLAKNPATLRYARLAYKHCREMGWEESADYLTAKNDQLMLRDPERGREQGMKQFLDDKSYRPGLGGYKREG